MFPPAPGQPRVYVIGPVPRTIAAGRPTCRRSPARRRRRQPSSAWPWSSIRLASGSGFAVGKKLVVTNAHVVEGAFPDEIKVQFGTENSTPQPIARILHFDRARDLCVMEVPSCTCRACRSAAITSSAPAMRSRCWKRGFAQQGDLIAGVQLVIAADRQARQGAGGHFHHAQVTRAIVVQNACDRLRGAVLGAELHLDLVGKSTFHDVGVGHHQLLADCKA